MGKVDLGKSNAISGEVQLTAEALDLTSYYDLFADQKKSNAPTTNASVKKVDTKPPSRPATPAIPPKPQSEPAPIALPFQQFSLDANIGQLYLREIAVNNWRTTAKFSRAQVNLKPLQLVLNGAPIKATADLNLGVPGYRYDLTFSADKVPLEPIANSFQPDKRGQLKGDLFVATRIIGAGITGTSMQKNLGGQFAFSFTNANVQVASPLWKGFLTPIALVLGAPDLVNTPLSWLDTRAQIGKGRIDVTQFQVVSDSFTADTAGEIKIADVFMDSPLDKWPMHFYLRSSFAKRIRMFPKNTSPDAQYAKLPDFIKVAGTIGAPKPELNKLALTGTVLEKALDRIPGLNEKTGGFNPLDLFRPKP
jgi:hypothetical protein